MLIHICDRCGTETKYPDDAERYVNVSGGEFCAECEADWAKVLGALHHYRDAVYSSWKHKGPLPQFVYSPWK